MGLTLSMTMTQNGSVMITEKKKQARRGNARRGNEGNAMKETKTENCWCRKMKETKNCWVYNVRKENMEGVGF